MPLLSLLDDFPWYPDVHRQSPPQRILCLGSCHFFSLALGNFCLFSRTQSFKGCSFPRPLPTVGRKGRLYASLRSLGLISGLSIAQERTELPACDPNDCHALRLVRCICEASLGRKVTEPKRQSLTLNGGPVVGTKRLPKQKPSALNRMQISIDND